MTNNIQQWIQATNIAEIIKTAHPKWPKNKHPATQSFLAIRLFINQELEALENDNDDVITIESP